MDNRPIGIFDSGLGGLTALKELRQLLPQEDLIYFGDTGRVPYGARSPQTLRRFAMENIRFLQSHDVKMIVAACGTISYYDRRDDCRFADSLHRRCQSGGVGGLPRYPL